MYRRILIANRGEIALRIMRACRELGVETVAVYSEGDRGANYLELADETFCIGPAKASDSYLKITNVIAAAEVGNVEAIHPGYGFLAENAHFNEVCRSSNFDFIGPSPEAMSKLGDKNMGRELARKAGVPVVPGSAGLIGSEADALSFANEVGFPVLIKAVAGGGGRGMRIAADESDLSTALHQAKAEAEAAFGNGDVYLEKFIEAPRHVEVQVLADQHGNAVHLWERDCSTQRRHQKLIEESPSPSIGQETRTAICESAVQLIKSADYSNAATVEFVLDQDDNYYFIEVNARIQVEHPVSELISGVDLIKAQLRIASGEPLWITQDDIPCSGHAIECRINAEDPAKNFQPSPGKIDRLVVPGGYGVRFDSHAHSGYSVPPYYDSMIGKLLVHQPTRDEAIACMLRALAELKVDGIKTTIPLHQEILSHTTFSQARIDTKFVERTFTNGK